MGGTGLGTFHCQRKFVDQNNGSIDIKSEVAGKGTVR